MSDEWKFCPLTMANVYFQFACVEKCPTHLPHLVEDTKQKEKMIVCADDEHPTVIARKKKNKA